MTNRQLIKAYDSCQGTSDCMGCPFKEMGMECMKAMHEKIIERFKKLVKEKEGHT